MKMIGDRPMTNAELQRRWQAKQRALGRKRRTEWVEAGLAGTTPEGGWKRMAAGTFLNELNAALAGREKMLCEVVYAELAAYIPKIIKRFSKWRTEADAQGIKQ